MAAQRDRVHGSKVRAGPAPPSSPRDELQHEARVPYASIDVLVATTLVVAAAFAFALLPEGSLLRLIVVLPTLFFAPGYLLIQALPIAATRRWSRAAHAVAAIGISPAIVGALALITSLVPGGFRPTAIVGTITFASILLAAVAIYRRTRPATPTQQEAAPGPARAAPARATPRRKQPDTAK